MVLQRLAWQRFQAETVVGVVLLGRPTRRPRPVSSFTLFEGLNKRLLIMETATAICWSWSDGWRAAVA